MLRVTLVHNGKPHPSPLEVPAKMPMPLFCEQVLSHLSLPPETPVRLLYAGKTLAVETGALTDTGLKDGGKLYVLSSSLSAVSAVRAAKPDPLVRPFGRGPQPRYVAAPRRTRPAPGAIGAASQYGFGRVEALPGFPDKDRAEAILESLRTDPGFLSVMQRKKWRVGALKEMPPEGRVGVDPVCVLGYNTNKGAEIHLRLRTDDRQGFRSMLSIRQVLAHELAHNEVSDHNNEFKELMRWIEREANKADWRRGQGRALVDGWRTAPGVEGVEPFEEDEAATMGRLNVVQRLGSSEDSGAGPSDREGMQRPGGSAEATRKSDEAVSERKDAVDTEMKESSSTVDVRDDENNSTEALGSHEGSEWAKVGADEAMGEWSRATAEQAQTSESGVAAKAKTGVEELVEMGFSATLAKLALRENGRDTSRAAEWLLSAGSGGQSADSGEAAVESERWTVARVEEAMRELRAAQLSREEVVCALDAVHLYLSNVLRNPGVERFTRINAGNAAFRRRVGGHAGATGLLSAAGFRLSNGVWTFASRDVAALWVTKSAVQDRLVEELLQR